jgi:hypothetical protein
MYRRKKKICHEGTKTQRKKRYLSWCLGVFVRGFGPIILCLVMHACATGTRLEPAPGALTLGDDKVVSGSAGVEVIADPDAWRGLSEITDVLLPIEVTIRNRHDSPILIRHGFFSLIRAEDNSRFTAVPPAEMTGTIRIVRTSPFVRPANPFFGYYPSPWGPQVYPYYGRVYPDYTYIENISLPTGHMMRVALKEGLLAPGEDADGFVYFKNFIEAARSPGPVAFTMDLVSASGDKFGEVVMSFVVER